MPTLTMRELAEMTHGEVVQNPDVIISSVVIDSREVKPDSVFFAIKGERLDGHQFVPQALETARGAVVARIPESVARDKGIVRVADTTKALQELARSIRNRYKFLLIAITGSAGKTTTKEMIATLVATERRTWKSWGNFNNLIGCPLCIDNTPDDAEVVVSEMGMNHKGEIALLAGLTHPDVGVYTNIGPVHIEFFGTIEKIAEAKKELLDNLAPSGTVVLNVDNEYVMNISRGFTGRKVTYGIDHTADFRPVSILELGERELEYHYEAGREIPNAVDIVVAVGRRSEALLDGARHAGFSDERLYHFDNAETATGFLERFIRPGDLVLVKASRGIGLDKIVTKLQADREPRTAEREA